MTALLEPTEEMIEAGVKASRDAPDDCTHEQLVATIYLAMVASTPQEPDDDALIELDRLLRMTVPVPAGCVGAEGEPMSPEFRVSIQRVTGDGVHFIIHAHGHSSDTLDLVATPQRLALLARFKPGETQSERIARTATSLQAKAPAK